MNLGMENETLEFKKSTNELEKGIISLSAMLNKHCEGTLYFGVKNDGTIVGQKEINENTLRDISRKISEGIKPQIIPNISLELIEDKEVIKVSAKAKNIPYSAFGKYYIRSHDEDKSVSPDILRQLMNTSGEDDLIVKEPSNKIGLTFKLLKNLYSINGLTINEDYFEKNTNLLTMDNKYNYMAELLADENDVSIKVVTFAGTDKSVMLKRTEYGYKCLLVALEQVIQYMESINETKVKIGGFQRQEEKYFDIECFKEAWSNACAHTRWIEKIPPAVYIYDDRIEIVSNGGLPSNLNKEDFYKGVSKPVNSELLNIMTKLDIIDQTGHGVPLIVKKYGKKVFYISDNTIIVTIPINKELLEKDDKFIDELFELNETERKALNLIRKNEKITREVISKELNISDRHAARLLDSLKSKKIIERVGSNKSGYWKILE